jgi:hypothetical protein
MKPKRTAKPSLDTVRSERAKPLVNRVVGKALSRVSRSTTHTVVEQAIGWKGDDLEEIMNIVARTRSKSRF